ncbi:putative ribonuclease H-like domain-containing protein [Tanacetum coccineum]
MSSWNMCHDGTNYLTKKYVGPTLSLGIVAGERIPIERSPATSRQGKGVTSVIDINPNALLVDLHGSNHVTVQDSGFPSLSEVADTVLTQDGGLNKGNTVINGSIGQVFEATIVPSGTPDATSAPGNAGTPNEANLQKLNDNVPNNADYDVWSPLASVHEGINSVLRDGPWMIRGIPVFLNKWLPSVRVLKEDFSRVSVWVKFHNIMFVAYTLDRLSLIATKIGTSMMLDSYTNSMCLESWGKSNYARILIKINASNDFSDNLVMAVSNPEGTGYTKETIRVEYKMAKGKGGSSEADDEGFIEVKKKKLCGNNGGNKNFKLVLVKPKTHYRPKAKQSIEGVSRKMTPSVGKKNVSTLGDGTFSLSNSFEALNVENPVIKEVKMGK